MESTYQAGLARGGRLTALGQLRGRYGVISPAHIHNDHLAIPLGDCHDPVTDAADPFIGINAKK
jgi:hypothetical protein